MDVRRIKTDFVKRMQHPEKLAKECSVLRVLAIFFILGNMVSSNTWPSHSFGSKIYAGDSDFGYPLDGTCPSLGFIDIGKIHGVYDEQDPVYFKMDSYHTISINDIRLTPFAIFPAGSKVAETDMDVDSPFTELHNWSLAYFDFDGNGIYSLMDPVYLHNKSIGDILAPNDIRLTRYNVFKAGTRVTAFDADAGLYVFDLMTIAPAYYIDQLAAIRFYNRNGNYIDGSPVFDRPDVLYMDISLPDQTHSNGKSMGLGIANDLRLSFE